MHGLSTAYHLALELKNRGWQWERYMGIDKSGIGAGASGSHVELYATTISSLQCVN
ncbi:MAG: hypothetical protein Ct9H300mP28_11060 [Pseudomonadota bacterium]|nr:MAG: hypothetical protein Ct9H300mP28_11060 [Pseudomonadota bacterium]